MDAPSLTELPAWQALRSHATALEAVHMRDLFADDPDRAARFSYAFGPVRLDVSKNRMTTETMALLMEFAAARGIEAGRTAMFAGARINTTEDRAVLHVALRNRAERPMMIDGIDVMPEVRETRTRLKKFSEEVRAGVRKGATGKAIKHIVNIGIGGSHLGPMFVADAMKDSQRQDISLAFVSNPDRAQIDDVLSARNPAETLFIIASKTFTTAETSANAKIARSWLTSHLGEGAVAKHFVAVSTNGDAAAAFGIAPDCIFPMWDWVGGRYSVWSAIGLAVMLACGDEAFDQLLAGAEAMDRHFETASLEQNLPVILALIGVWYADFFDAPAVAVMPYDHRLKLFPAHLQQMDMESNGKGVGLDGLPVATKAGPIVFGGGGSDSQHSFFQLLHQSPRLIPCDFIVALKGQTGFDASRDLLVANAFAQTEALMRGRAADELADVSEALRPHRVFTGNRPSNTVLLDELTPYVLGMLIALYEHKVFVQGLIWGVNSFDQWGVELGKELAKTLAPILTEQTQAAAEDSLTARDSSTAGLVLAYLQAKADA